MKQISWQISKTGRCAVFLFVLVFSPFVGYAQRPVYEQNEEKTVPIPNIFNFQVDSTTQNVRSRKAPMFFSESHRFAVKAMRFNSQDEELFPVFYKQGLFFHRLRDKYPLRLGISSWNNLSRTRIFYVTHPDSMREQKRVDAAVRQSLRSNIVGAYFRDAEEHIIFAKTNALSINIFNKHEVQKCKSSLYEGKVSRNVWYSVAPIPIPETEGYSVAHPCLSADGTMLFFTSDMPGGYGGTDIYFCLKKENGTWNTPQNLGNQINSPADEITPYYHSEDGNLYFASNKEGGMGGFDIYEASKIGAFFEKVKNLGSPINSEDDDISFIVSPSKRVGYFSTNRRGSFDIFQANVLFLNVSRNLTDGGENVYGQFNFELTGHVFDSITGQPIKRALVKIREVENDEIRVSFTDNSGKYRFQIQNEKNYQLVMSKLGFQTTKDYDFSTFSILNPEPIVIDIMMPPVNYRFRLNVEVVGKDTVSEVINKSIPDARLMLEETNTHEMTEVYADMQGKYSFDLQQDKDYKITAFKDGYDASLPYHVRTIRKNNAQSFDLQIPLQKNNNAKRRAVVRAIITNTEDGGAIVGAKVGLKNKTTGQEITGMSDDNGIAIFVVDTLYNYQLWCEKDKYQANDFIEAQTAGTEAGKVVEVIMPMRAVKYKPVPLSFVLPSIYYPAGKVTFNDEVGTQLDAIVKIMKEYSGLKVNLFSHTDNTDKPKLNEELSRQRANATISYLEKKGINRSRIVSVVALGATKMKYDCSKMNCTEEQHGENRRIDFVIVQR
ncbi:MAG: hypothetical protein EAZ08_13785 [Cytophagales bacterium]|nr:MAG: hypothetical protein EAZ08_13785 [Cytophagales bacterium]